MAVTTTVDLAPIVAARARGTAYLLRHLGGEGAEHLLRERLFYYRVPWTLALVGETAAAHRLVSWVRQHMLTAEGEFAGAAPRGIFDQRWGSYPLAILVHGAHLLGRYEVAYPGYRRLLTWLDPASGGAYNRYDQRGPGGEQEIFPTAQAGMTALVMGDLATARRAAAWLARLWQAQPAPERCLYSVWRDGEGLVTSFPPDQSFFYVTRKGEPWEQHYNGGIAAAFLARLYLADPDPAHLDLARQYQAFTMTSGEVIFQSAQTCKSSWGAALLYLATREPAYHDWLVRMARWYQERQFPEGHWENTRAINPTPTLADNLEVTAEFVQHVDTIVAALSS